MIEKLDTEWPRGFATREEADLYGKINELITSLNKLERRMGEKKQKDKALIGCPHNETVVCRNCFDTIRRLNY